MPGLTINGRAADAAGLADFAGAVGDAGGVVQLRQVATRCQLPTTFSTQKNAMCRSYRHMRTSGIRRFRLVLSNGFVDSSNSFTEKGLGATMTARATIEYPLGTHTRVTWGGATSGQIPELTHLVSDWINVAIPKDGKFGTDLWLDNASGLGLAYSSNKLAPDMGDLFALATGTADSTGGVTFAGTSTSFSLLPSAIIAETDNGAVIIIGDSIAFGVDPDTAVAANDGLCGIVEKSIGRDLPYINVAVAGDWAWYFRQSHAWRLDLLKYCTSTVFEYGINDNSNSRSAANMAADRQAFLKFLPSGFPAFLTTLLPKTTSTDSWATTANQTLQTSAKETARVAENTARRAIPAGWTGVFDTEAAVVSAPASGLWAVNGAANYLTTDGTHPTPAANELVRVSGVISVSTLSAYRAPPGALPLQYAPQPVVRRTVGKTLIADDVGRLFSNFAATALNTYTLPSPTEGAVYEFYVADADGIKVQCATDASSIASSIQLGGSASATGGFIQSTTVGSFVQLQCLGGLWFARQITGTWTAT